MFYYKIYGLTVKSDYELEEAMEIEQPQNIDVVVEAGELPKKVTGDTEEERKKEGMNVYVCHPDKTWFRWYEYGSFMVTDGNRITYQLKPGCDLRRVNEIILCLAFSYILFQRKMIILHGSGLVWKDRTFVVSGHSGSGKSTLSEAFLKDGAKFLADDMVAIEMDKDGAKAMPAYPQQKLCPDQITEEMKATYTMVELAKDVDVTKYGVRMINRFCKEPKKPDALIVIQKSDDISEPVLEKISGSDKLKYLLGNLFLYDTYVRTGLSVEIFKKCMDLANSIEVYLLSRPSVGLTVDKQKELIEKELG